MNLGAFAKAMEGNVDGYDAEKLKGIIDRFGEALMKHLGDEILSLIELDKFGEEKLLKAWIDREQNCSKEACLIRYARLPFPPFTKGL